MKLTFSQIIPAYKALQALSGQLLPLPVAWALTKAKQALQPHYDFFAEEEIKAIRQYGGTPNEGGKITFEDQEKCAQYTARVQELYAMEPDAELQPIALNVDALAGVQITVNDLAALQPLLKE